MRYFNILLVVTLLFCGTAHAAPDAAWPIDVGPLPDGLGVNIHFTDPRPGEMRMLADAGFKWVRMDFGWGGTEREKGRYDFGAYDRLMAALGEHHIRPIFILDYSNRFYDDDQSPRSDEGRAAFANWAAASVTHFKGRGVIWEMYNEPNIGFWRPKPNVEDYTKLSLAVGKSIREAAPQEVYIGPACSTMDFRFLEGCFKAGCLEYWSAVSVHPYRQQEPETVATDYRHLRELIARYAPKGKQVPIISGEWGYSSAWNNFDEQKQGRYLARELLTNIASGVPISIWYDWHDDGDNPREPEHHFGTVHHEYHAGRDPVYDPKPAYATMKMLSAALEGCRFEKRLDAGADADWVLLFRGAGGPRIAAWAVGPDHEATISASPGTFHVSGPTGQPLPDVVAGPTGLRVRLSGQVQYLAPAGRNALLDAIEAPGDSRPRR